MSQTTLFGKLLLGALYVSIATAILAVAVFAVSASIPSGKYVLLGGEKIMVEVASTQTEQSKGLSGHKKLESNEGMLFVFPKSESYAFWMKDMLFPIDIIWFDENRRIVDMWEDAIPDSYPQIHTPSESSCYVLEVNASYARTHHLQKGDILTLSTLQ